MQFNPLKSHTYQYFLISLGITGLLALTIFLFLRRDSELLVSTDSAGQMIMADQQEFSKPKNVYIVIDTALNRLYIKQQDRILREATCSTGSGLELATPQHTWHFRTPRGVFQIVSKTKNPVWRKPDWAFLEEGLEIPRDESGRFEANVLGQYAVGIGDGYFIHGTLYTRLLGRNVTHGCIRLGDDDLKYLVDAVPLGATVFIF